MPRIPFQKPKKVEWEILTDRYGRLVAEPFEKGYALTVGHSLRRTLLAIVAGAAVTWVRIPGIKDVDAKISGVEEDTTDVLLNLKKLAVNVPSGEPTETRLAANERKLSRRACARAPGLFAAVSRARVEEAGRVS